MAGAQSMQDRTEERIKYIEQVQMPLFEKAAQERKAPFGWATDMKTVVMPLAIKGMRILAQIADEFNETTAFIDRADFQTKEEMAELISRARAIGENSRILSQIHQQYKDKSLLVSKRHDIPLAKSWKPERDKWDAVIQSGLSVGMSANRMSAELSTGQVSQAALVEFDSSFGSMADAINDLWAGAEALQGRVEEALQKRTR